MSARKDTYWSTVHNVNTNLNRPLTRKGHILQERVRFHATSLISSRDMWTIIAACDRIHHPRHPVVQDANPVREYAKKRRQIAFDKVQNEAKSILAKLGIAI